MKYFTQNLIAIFFIINSFSLYAQQGTNTQQTTSTHNQQETYPIIVSFYSIGSGTNKAARKQFQDYIEKFEKRYHLNIDRGETSWGREGETDYCFDLMKMSHKKKSKFIRGLKSLLGKAPQVRITENSPCPHKK